MSSGVVSKNLFDVLGNDPELDPDREPEPPVKTVDKPAARHGKRNAPAEAPVRDAAKAGRGGRQDNATGSELAFRDRNAGAQQNRNKPTDEFRSDRHPNRLQDGEQKHSGGRGRSRGQGGYRGGRGGGGGGQRDDRHSKTGVSDTDKQVGQGWGGQSGAAEWDDEKAGEAIAKADEKEEGFVPEPVGNGDGPETAEGEPAVAAPEPEEDKTKSYSAYLKEQEEKRAALSGGLEIRKPNEGSKKQPEGKAITRDDEEDFIAGTGGKAKRERARKEKTLLELDDQRLHSAPQDSFRGRGRGGRGRGEGSFRGEGRGRGGRGRGDRSDRGGDRGDRGDRGEYRGGRGNRSAQSPNVSDTKAFPTLGA